MPLLNVSVVSTGNSHIPWTVVQIEPGLTFIELLAKILSGAYQMLHVDEFLSQSIKLDKVFIGQSRDCLSIVDEKLVIDDVCKAFGQHVKFVVVQSGTQTYRNAFKVLMQAQCAIDLKPLPSRVHERTKKDKLYNDIISFLESKSWTWESRGDDHGKKFVSQLQESLWYLDGHHQTFADRSHPIPSIFKRFSGYNTPELAKHRKRSHVNMNADVLKKHASSFLLSPWMKKDCWAVMKTAIEELTAAIEFYVYELAEKNRAVKKHSGTFEVASDELPFRVLDVTNDSPVVLKSLTEALQSKQVYEPIFIRDFAPVDRRDRYTYVRLLETGLPVKCVLCTKSFGASIGKFPCMSLWNVHYVKTNELLQTSIVIYPSIILNVCEGNSSASSV